MRDVIIIGAGGGDAVVAKELAARGCLCSCSRPVRATPIRANALGGANPTLTTQELATRTAEVIVQRYCGGDPWVGREAPVVSTDDAVTRAVVARGL